MGDPTSTSEVQQLLAILRAAGVTHFEGMGIVVTFGPVEAAAPAPEPPEHPDADLYGHERVR